MYALLRSRDLVLMEAAVVERLRRDTHLALDPRLVHAPLVYDAAGRRAMGAIFEEYIAVADRAGLPLLVCTPTWRANRARVAESGMPESINVDAVAFVRELLNGRPRGGTVRVGGLIGCKNDCYRPAEGLSAAEAEAFHGWQVGQLSDAGVDFLMAATLPALPEAIGIARAMARTARPHVISFVIDRNGRLLDGTGLDTAIERIDADTARAPLGYMINCAHPSFLHPGSMAQTVLSRLVGVQANASSLDHAELDGATDHHSDDVDDWAACMLDLNRRYGVKILGGCCGTGVAHLRAVAVPVAR